VSISTLALVSAINDAAMIVSTFAPLVRQAMTDGKTEVTDEQVSAAISRLDGDIERLNAAVEAARARG
jgi:hypothetical protein